MHTDRFDAGHPYQDRFPELVEYAAFEGGVVFLVGDSSPCYVILDEGTLADFIHDDDGLIAVHTFDDPAEREQWLRNHVSKSNNS